MNSIIKSFKILIAFLFLSFSAFAQDNFPLLRSKLDHVFTKIDKSQIPTGILEEYSFGFMNLNQVNTESTMPRDSLHYINGTVWRMTYATLLLS